MKAKANPTNDIELPSTTPNATIPSWLPHAEPGLYNDDVGDDMLNVDGKPWNPWPVV
jgi:hypothetical protein